MGDAIKALVFCGGALDDLRAFPSSARRAAGYELDKVQNGRSPSDWKAMNRVGAGVREIRIWDAFGAFRILYVIKFAETVYVLHCFQKTTQATSRSDLSLAANRYRDLVRERRP